MRDRLSRMQSRFSQKERSWGKSVVEKLASDLQNDFPGIRGFMARCKDPLEREFYLRMTAKFGWTKAALTHQIENQSYEKTLLGQTNFDRALTPALRAQAKLAVMDEYAFDFLELGEAHSERQLERALIARIEHFLRAMGGLFAFVGSQFPMEVDFPLAERTQ